MAALGAGLSVASLSQRAQAAPTKTTQPEPDGFFTLGQRDGHWWLITPDGRPFFSIGLNLCGAYQRNRARRYGLLDEQEKPDRENVALMKAANQKISQWMDSRFDLK
jgi:hypothetical protein